MSGKMFVRYIILQNDRILLPAGFNDAGFVHNGRHQNTCWRLTDENGYEYNLKKNGPTDPIIVYSNNSPWHIKRRDVNENN